MTTVTVRKTAWIRSAFIGAAVLGIAALLAKPVAKWVDLHWTAGGLKDTWGALRWREDWNTAVPVPAGLDGAWIDSAETPIRVAHALGASAHADANSLAALDRAAKDGFHLFEVDLWIDPAGRLRCQHEDETALSLAAGDCTLDRLLPRIASVDGWVILDIKSDFERTGRAVVQLLRANGLGSHVVFQLYRAGDMGLFAQWARQVTLAEPLVTTYASHRSVQHIADHAAALKLRVMTLPLSDLPMLTRRPAGLSLLVHPIHDCGDWDIARREHVAGIYTLTGLRCGDWTALGLRP